MRRREALKLFAGLALCPLCASTGFASEGHWSYEGATGPEKRGSLDAAAAACSAGSQQLPVDITAPVSARQPPLNISWSKRPDTIVNNGHTIQLDFAEGGALHMGDRQYALKQFHFHHPSEHLVGGKRFAMEVASPFTPGPTGWPSSACLWLPASRTRCSRGLSRRCHGKKARPSRQIQTSIPEGCYRPSVRITTMRDRSRHPRAVRQSIGLYLLTRSRWTKMISHASASCTQ